MRDSDTTWASPFGGLPSTSSWEKTPALAGGTINPLIIEAWECLRMLAVELEGLVA